MAPLPILSPAGLPFPLWAGATRRPSVSSSVPTSVETTTLVENPPVRMATSPASPPVDTSLEASSTHGGSDGVPSLSRGRGGLLPPFLLVPTSAGGMAGDGCRTHCHMLGQGVLEFSQRGYLPLGGRMAADFRHLVVGVATSQPGHLLR